MNELEEIESLIVRLELLIGKLEDDRRWGIRWTAIAAVTFAANVYFAVFDWPHARPLWWAAMAGALNLTCAGYLARNVYRFWKVQRWAMREARETMAKLLRLRIYYGR